MELGELLQAGVASRRKRDFQTAVTHYLRALEADPNHLQALEGLADAFRGLKRWGLCLQTWERYLALKPENAAVQSRVGDACRSLGKGSRAAEHYRAALHHDPRNRFALRGLGDLHQREHRPAEALAYWERLVEVEPEAPAVRATAGQLCLKLTDFRRAELHFREALRLDPASSPATFGLGDALRGQGRYVEASGCWDRVLQAEPRNRQALCRAGDCSVRLGRLERAGALFGQALAQGYDRSALLGLARVHLARGDAGGASRCCESILARNPADVRTGQLLSRIRQVKGPP